LRMLMWAFPKCGTSRPLTTASSVMDAMTTASASSSGAEITL
jgi:hypothetical protein